MVVIFIYGVWNQGNEDIRRDIKQVKRDVIAATSQPTDSTQVHRLHTQIDSLKQELKGNQALIGILNTKLAKQGQQLDGLLELLISLQRSIKRVDANVERTRRTVPTPSPFAFPQPPSTQINPNRVR
ncbi:hypothetical protein A6C57_00275 [Fibrella sp. ES10-3-2-2]|nr:hypothetical protein A6C57_00275 [Fibrella sp. ES10-3-2-2]